MAGEVSEIVIEGTTVKRHSLITHSTLAAFISRSPETIQSVFQQLLLVCHEEELTGQEIFAIDGVKMPSNVAKEWGGRRDELAYEAKQLRRAAERMLESVQAHCRDLA